MFKFDVVYFISLFEDFDTNEQEIYSILNGMDRDDLYELEIECNKNLAKYYDIYWTTDDAWHMMHEEDELMKKEDNKVFEYEAESFMVPMDEFNLYEYSVSGMYSLKEFMKVMVDILEDAELFECERTAEIYNNTMKCMWQQIEMIAYIVEKYNIYPYYLADANEYATILKNNYATRKAI